MNDLFKFDTKATSLLGTEEFRNHLRKALEKTESKLLVCSGFVTYEGVKWLKNILTKKIDCTILTFWTAKYLLEGSCDLKSFEFCRDNDWNFRVLDRYHGKTMKFDDNLIAVGSGNLTQRGIGLIPESNKETGVFKELNLTDQTYFDKLIESSKEITNSDFEKLKKYCEENKLKKTKTSYPPLPISLKPDEKIQTDQLWVDHFPSLSIQQFSNYEKDDDFYKHELDLFDINDFNREIVKEKFKDTYIYKWTKSVLKDNDNKLYFGKMSNIIHNNLLDEARQYRREVKILQSNLYSYIREFNYDDIKLTRPNHSELLELL